jgi:hypothetical protein
MDSIFTLSLAIVILALIAAAQSMTLPWLWWRALKLEQKVETLDEMLSGLMEVAGLKPSPPATTTPPTPPVPPNRVVKREG